MSNRYKPVGNWYPNNSEITVFGGDTRYAQYVNIDVSDVVEVRNSQIWHNGAHRIKVTRPPGYAGILPRGKTFIGEMAWAQAARYAEDAIASIRKAIEGR